MSAEQGALRAAIYCRVSGPGQKNTTSLPEQERLCREQAASLGWDVSEPHVYHEVMGGEDLYRPQMDRLWDAIIKHEVSGVVIDVLDRLSRDEGDQGAFYHHCDRYDVTVELASEDRDETDQGRNLRTLTGIMSRMERVEIRRRTQRGRKARVASGKMLTGAFPLYGYLWGDPDKGKQRTHYVIDPETAPVVVRIFERVADGIPIRQIARELETEGVPTPFQVLAARGMLPNGRTASPAWGRGQMFRMLHNPAYWGEHSAYRFAHTSVKIRPADTGMTRKVWRVNERDVDDAERVALPDACPPLVSKEVAARVAARLIKNKEDNPGRNADPLATIFRGMVVCGHCGGKMFTAPGIKGRRYCCHSHIAVTHSGGVALPVACPSGWMSMLANALDPAGWADVRAWLSEPANVSRLLAEWDQEEQRAESSVASRLDASAAMIAMLRDKMGRLAETISETSEKESRRVLQEKLDAYAAQARKEEGKRERLLSEARDAAQRANEERDVREWVRIVADRAATFTRAEQVTTLHALGAQVTVWRADHVHADGWPQRYKIVLNFTGFTGQPVTLPARHCKNHASNNL
ncbi:MAG TPA: recombinase family protein [Ktedonobacterales bacterium]|nr:recombinase family protein [Ktedonobacterales bacterium]